MCRWCHDRVITDYNAKNLRWSRLGPRPGAVTWSRLSPDFRDLFGPESPGVGPGGPAPVCTWSRLWKKHINRLHRLDPSRFGTAFHPSEKADQLPVLSRSLPVGVQLLLHMAPVLKGQPYEGLFALYDQNKREVSS